MNDRITSSKAFVFCCVISWLKVACNLNPQMFDFVHQMGMQEFKKPEHFHFKVSCSTKMTKCPVLLTCGLSIAVKLQSSSYKS